MRSKRRWPRRLLFTANLLVLVLLAVGASAYGYVRWRLDQVHRVVVNTLSPPAPPGQPMTILLVGSDTRDLGKGGSSAFGSSSAVTGQRSDTIVLVHVVPATSSIALLSLPRDLLLPVAGFGTTRINASFSGGPDLLVQTIQQDLGIKVNHFAVVNFATFISISDAVGGVYQYFPVPAKDIYSNLVVPNAGCVLLKGSQALAFVRSREYQYYLNGTWNYQLVPESDLARIQRQQDFIKLALKKAEQVAPTNPFALNDVLSGITSSITVDSKFSTSAMINLALSMRHANVSGIPNWTYPTVNSVSVPGALDAVPSEDQQVVSEFLAYGMPRPKAMSTSVTSPPVAASSISVRVLNGSGVAGQAGAAAAALKAKGFKVSGSGNASSYNYKSSVVEYGPDGLGAARELQSAVPGGATLALDAALGTGQLVLITGQGYGQVTATASALIEEPQRTAAALALYVTSTSASAAVPAALPAAVPAAVPSAPAAGAGPGVGGTIAAELAGYIPPAAQASSPVEPDSSSYFHGRYIPPGLLPGQVPPTCPS